MQHKMPQAFYFVALDLRELREAFVIFVLKELKYAVGILLQINTKNTE